MLIIFNIYLGLNRLMFLSTDPMSDDDVDPMSNLQFRSNMVHVHPVSRSFVKSKIVVNNDNFVKTELMQIQ